MRIKFGENKEIPLPKGEGEAKPIEGIHAK